MVLVMLLTQVAVAAYACPGSLQAARVSGTSAMTTTVSTLAEASDPARRSMANCDDMQGRLDPSAPNLCHACCHHDQQPDNAGSLAVPAVILNSLYAVPALISLPVPARFDAPSSSDLAAAAPPRTVLHCCWRI
jgi:hypothetical protein